MDALDDIGTAFLTADYYADCLTTDDCGATSTTQVLEHTDDTLVLFTYRLRRAEAYMATQFMDTDQSVEEPSPSVSL